MKVAIAGAGYIANIHARAVVKSGGEVAAVVEKFDAPAQAFARQHAVPRRYESVEELVQAGGVDALVIGTPNFLHVPQALCALQAGLHVLVEKPAAMDAAGARLLMEASRRSAARLMVAHCWRFDEDVLWLKGQAGRLGKIVRTRGYGIHTHWGPPGWFTQKALAGGGALADMGIHALDTARFLLGDPQPVSVFARLGTYYQDCDVDDTGVVLVTWDNGAVSYIESGWWQPHMDGPEAATQLYGLEGFGQLFPTRLELPGPDRPRVRVVDPGFAFPRPEHCPQAMYDAQMAYFFDCIRSGQEPCPGIREGLVNMQIVDAAYESSRTGKSVEIEPGTEVP